MISTWPRRCLGFSPKPDCKPKKICCLRTQSDLHAIDGHGTVRYCWLRLTRSKCLMQSKKTLTPVLLAAVPPHFSKGKPSVQPVRYYLDQLNVPIGTCSAWLMRPRPIPAWVSFCKGNSNSKVEQKYCQYYFGENKWMNERFCPSFSLPLVFLMLTRNEDLTSHRLTNMLLFRLS